MAILKHTDRDIKNSIIHAFLEKKPQHFIPFLMSENVLVDVDNKVKFYKIFKSRIVNSRVKGKIRDIRIEKEVNGFYDDYLQLNFYDETHLHSRFSIFYKYEEDEIHLGLMPF